MPSPPPSGSAPPDPPPSDPPPPPPRLDEASTLPPPPPPPLQPSTHPADEDPPPPPPPPMSEIPPSPPPEAPREPDVPSQLPPTPPPPPEPHGNDPPLPSFATLQAATASFNHQAASTSDMPASNAAPEHAEAGPSSRPFKAVDTSSAKMRPSLAVPPDPQELDRLMSRESLSFFQELEIERVLTAFKLNPYDVLEVPLEADDKMINKIYRKKSLLIHPDKVKHERAIEAFDLLKKASSHLLDQDKRKALDETVLSAKFLVLREELGLPTSLSSDSPQLVNLNPPFEERVRKATKALMIDDELRKRKSLRMQHAMEGEEERKREAALEERKRKADEKVKWEDTRDERVAGWRAFAKGGAGKKRKKVGGEVLG